MTAARDLLAGAIDYAGLFPPASVDMRIAVAAYAEYRAGPQRDMLGRFIVPASRLDELAQTGAQVFPRDGEPWRISVIAGQDIEPASKDALAFNDSHRRGSDSGHAVCDAMEIAVAWPADITAAAAAPESFELFIEIPVANDPEPYIDMIAPTGAAAKIRTGGVVESAIPSPQHVLRFIDACVRSKVRFKATAGLHHAIRGSYPLTYERGAERATMYGFLNVFLAAAFCMFGTSEAALAALEESDASAFDFDGNGVTWRGKSLTADQLSEVRRDCLTSFGSCSFTEPVEEAQALALLEAQA